MEQRRPVSLDTTGRDIHGEAAHLREQGPAVPVTLPGGVVARSVNSYAVIKQLLADPNVTHDLRDPLPLPTFIMNGHRSLPVRLTEAAAAAEPIAS
jgi:hypothetical protein